MIKKLALGTTGVLMSLLVVLLFGWPDREACVSPGPCGASMTIGNPSTYFPVVMSLGAVALILLLALSVALVHRFITMLAARERREVAERNLP